MGGSEGAVVEMRHFGMESGHGLIIGARLDTWALEEARRRLEKEGVLEDPSPSHVLPDDEYTSTREGKHPPV